MKKFELVTVYEDPITCKKIEGKAKLIRGPLDRHLQGCERWDVRFLNEHTEYTREINVENH